MIILQSLVLAQFVVLFMILVQSSSTSTVRRAFHRIYLHRLFESFFFLKSFIMILLVTSL